MIKVVLKNYRVFIAMVLVAAVVQISIQLFAGTI